jgi:hypothetical protein
MREFAGAVAVSDPRYPFGRNLIAALALSDKIHARERAQSTQFFRE